GGLGRIAIVAAAALGVGAVGLLEDGRAAYLPRLAVQTAAAAAVVAAGIRTDITAIAAIDFMVSVLGIAAVTNAFSLLDVEEKLAPALGAVSATAIFVLAALSHQPQLAHLAGALAGACVGVLVYRGRGGARLGNCGTLFIGFLVSAGALALDARVGRLGDALVALLLWSLPLLNLLLVVVGRSRRNLSVTSPAADQLSQRLGRSAFAVLVVVQSVLALLAVMTGRSILSNAVAAAGAAALLAVPFVWAVRRDPYDERVVGLPRRARQVVLAAGVLLVVATAAAGISLLAARGPLRNGADSATAALDAARAGDYQRASALFADSERFFSIGRNRLQGPLPSLGLSVPGVSSNIRAARLLAGVGNDLAASGRTLATDVRPERLRMQGGAVPLGEIARIAPALRDAADVMTASERRIRSANLPYLFAPVRDAVDAVEEKLHSVSGTTRRGADAAELAPRILGGAQPRRYLLAIQNSAESRATGGFIGNFGELVAEHGRITLAKFGSIDTLRDSGVPFSERSLDAPTAFTKRFADRMPEIKSWLHVNITPDFPTAARLMESLYPQSGGQRVDGVLAVDPVGLAALLKLTGPVSVAGWPEPLTADNIVRVTTRDQYEPDLTYGERRDFLGAVAETVWRRVSSSDFGTPYSIADALGPAATGRHIQFSLRQPREARFVREVGIAGGLAPVRSDSLMFVTHNAAGNKLDAYLRRTVAYRVRIEPDGDGTARVSGVVDVTLHNDAPATGLPLTVFGDPGQPITPGENFSYSSLYSPLTAVAVLVDGKRYPFRSDKDVGELAHSTFLRVAPGKALKVQALLTGRIRLTGGDTYVLDVAHQARLTADRVEVTVELPKGWEIVGSQGLRPSGPGRAFVRFDQQADRTLSLQIRSRGVSGLWAAVTD
ncbi:MAG: DUF4012 domain-containing protein, partial [Actinobacteria bacterium]|nr:DUF4012 domain-containing protein [Actinomycetota bacterium]